MKIKLVLLLLISVFLTYLIYNKNYTKTIEILSINSLYDNDNYNKNISNILSKSDLNFKLNIDYSNNNLEIENLIAKINNNSNNIQKYLHNSDAIILSIGNIDIQNEDYKIYLDELKELLKLVRIYNSKQILYVSPPNFKNTTLIKQLCHKYNIVFINGSSFQNKKELLAQMLIKKIEINYNKEKY